MFGVPPEKQVLQLLGSGILADRNKVADYKIRNNTIIVLSVKSNTTMTVFVKEMLGKEYYLEVCPSTFFSRFKEMIFNTSGIPVRLQRLTFAGKCLEDFFTFLDYNIQKESTIILNRGD